MISFHRFLLLRFSFSVLALVSWVGCVTPMPESIKTPVDKNSVLIGVSVTQEAPIAMFSSDPDKVLFLKLTDPKILKGTIIESSYAKSGNIYLANVEPGTYVLIGAFWEKSNGTTSVRYSSIYDEAIAKATQVEAKPGQFAYMGKLLVKDDTESTKQGVSTFDSLMNTMVNNSVVYFGKLKKIDRSEESRSQFLQSAKLDFKGTPWIDILK